MSPNVLLKVHNAAVCCKRHIYCEVRELPDPKGRTFTIRSLKTSQLNKSSIKPRVCMNEQTSWFRYYGLMGGPAVRR